MDSEDLEPPPSGLGPPEAPGCSRALRTEARGLSKPG